MHRRYALLIGIAVVGFGTFLSVRYWPWRQAEPVGPTGTTFVIERLEYDITPGKKISASFANRDHALGFRAANVKNPFTLTGSFSPATATLDGEIVIRQTNPTSESALESRHIPEVDSTKPGTWKVTIWPESPWPLPLNQNYMVTTMINGKKSGVILVDGIETPVTKTVLQVTAN